MSSYHELSHLVSNTADPTGGLSGDAYADYAGQLTTVVEQQGEAVAVENAVMQEMYLSGSTLPDAGVQRAAYAASFRGADVAEALSIGSLTQNNNVDRVFTDGSAATNIYRLTDDLTDLIWGGAGNDVIFGGGGSDWLYGARGADRIAGGDGNDRLYGGADIDILEGQSGNDYLAGGTGVDTLNGGDGRDVLNAENDGSKDILDGQNGADEYYLWSGDEGRDSSRDQAADYYYYSSGSLIVDADGKWSSTRWWVNPRTEPLLGTALRAAVALDTTSALSAADDLNVLRAGKTIADDARDGFATVGIDEIGKLGVTYADGIFGALSFNWADGGIRLDAGREATSRTGTNGNDKGVAYDEVDLTGRPQERDALCQRAGGRNTVPQIWIGSAHIGGCDDLHCLDRDGRLDAMLGT